MCDFQKQTNMDFTFHKTSTIAVLFVTLSNLVSCTPQEPSAPLINYNANEQTIRIIQTDTAAHDTAFINILDMYNNKFPIKDTLNISPLKILQNVDQILFAYNIATHKGEIPIIIKTSRTCDTTFFYRYKNKEIPPALTATVTKGICAPLCDINKTIDHKDDIRLWIFKHKKKPDSILTEKMNSYIKQFNYSGYREYSPTNHNIPIVASLQDKKYKINANLPGVYFYLLACQSESEIKYYVENKISNGLKDAKHSLAEDLSCDNGEHDGTNALFLIAIDENWNYDILPVGLIIVDNKAPSIQSGHRRSRGLYSQHIYHRKKENKIVIRSHKTIVNTPQTDAIFSNVSVLYGSFQGDDYYGYKIPFYINASEDIKSITIGRYRLNAEKIRGKEYIRLHFGALHIGPNSIPITAVDLRGNKAKHTLNIQIKSIEQCRSCPSDDYDDLESRVSDLEGRID